MCDGVSVPRGMSTKAFATRIVVQVFVVSALGFSFTLLNICRFSGGPKQMSKEPPDL